MRNHGKSMRAARMLIEDAIKRPDSSILYLSPMEYPPMLSTYAKMVRECGFTFHIKKKEKQGDLWGRVITIRRKKQ